MKNLNIAIVCGRENGSPRVLAETLKSLVDRTGHSAQVFYRAKAFRRLFSHKQVKYNQMIWTLYKLKHLAGDFWFFKKLRKKDAVIICDWTPNGFFKDTYNIDRLKAILKGKSILYYAVQYLKNSPTMVEKLTNGGHPLIERYDWHLTVSSVTEIRGVPSAPWAQIGINLQSTGLRPEPKDEFLAIVDFERKGYEKYRETQIEILKKLNIHYISLEKKYSLEAIRKIYRSASIFFIQFPESFGLPIAENLACGTYILTPDSSWPMAWRLDENPEVHGPGSLPECFVVYNGKTDLENKLKNIRDNYNLTETPKKVFQSFYNHYKSFYEGDKDSLNEVLERLKTGELKN